jgi:hypothetical protein
VVLIKKLSKREKEEIARKKDYRYTTWFCFIFGIIISIGGLKRWFSDDISIQMSSRTNYPILSNGLYPTIIGLLFVVIGLYRIFFLKKK